MQNILYINACVRKDSRTKQLAKTALSCLQGNIEEVDLNKENILPLTREALTYRDHLLSLKQLDAPELKYARQYAKADLILIAAPYWDLSFPASLKSYMEAINVCGISFYYDKNGLPSSMCNAKKLIYVTTAGGPIPEPNMGFEYIQTLAKVFHGIKDIEYYKAEGLDIYGADVESILQQAKERIIKGIQ